MADVHADRHQRLRLPAGLPNAINRYVYMLARDGVLPAFLGRTHPKFKSPHRAGQLQTLLAAVVITVCAILNADPYQQLLIWVNTPGIFGIVGFRGWCPWRRSSTCGGIPAPSPTGC